MREGEQVVDEVGERGEASVDAGQERALLGRELAGEAVHHDPMSERAPASGERQRRGGEGGGLSDEVQTILRKGQYAVEPG